MRPAGGIGRPWPCIAFYTNPSRPEAGALAERAGAWLAEQGHSRSRRVRPDGSISVDGADLLVSLGGDGTLLRSVDTARPGASRCSGSISASSAT